MKLESNVSKSSGTLTLLFNSIRMKIIDETIIRQNVQSIISQAIHYSLICSGFEYSAMWYNCIYGLWSNILNFTIFVFDSPYNAQSIATIIWIYQIFLF